VLVDFLLAFFDGFLVVHQLAAHGQSIDQAGDEQGKTCYQKGNAHRVHLRALDPIPSECSTLRTAFINALAAEKTPYAPDAFP
jgi:hypothetical protein